MNAAHARSGCLLALIALCATLGTSSSSLAGQDAAADARTAEVRLLEQLTAYFNSADAAVRSESFAEVEALCEGNVERVADVLPRLKLWKSRGSVAQQFTVTLDVGWDEPLECDVKLPDSYDPDKAYRLVLCLRDRPGDGGIVDFQPVKDRPAIMVSPRRVPLTSFDSPPTETTIVRRLLEQLRRTLHIDENLVYLLGEGTGGDAAWQWAFAFPDDFAGLGVFDGYPGVPFAPQMLPLLLENIRGMPILTLWHESPELAAERMEPSASSGLLVNRASIVAAHNRALLAWATAPTSGFGWLRGQEVPAGAEAAFQTACADGLDRLLASVRSSTPKSTTYRFRYPEQGESRYLKQVRFLGEVWTHRELSILPAATADRDRVITDVLTSKLGLLRGQIRGQTLDLEVEHCERLELRFIRGLVDLSAPVKVVCNGKVRFEGLIQPRLRTMLEHAREEWRFTRPVLAKLAFNIDSTADEP